MRRKGEWNTNESKWSEFKVGQVSRVPRSRPEFLNSPKHPITASRYQSTDSDLRRGEKGPTKAGELRPPTIGGGYVDGSSGF